MFRIPNFYENAMSFDDGVIAMKNHGRGDLLEGLQAMDRVWEEHCSGSDRFEDDDDFFEHYEYEVNAYNVVFENMSKLFQ